MFDFGMLPELIDSGQLVNLLLLTSCHSGPREQPSMNTQVFKNVTPSLTSINLESSGYHIS